MTAYTRTALPAATASSPGNPAQQLVAADQVDPQWWHAFGSPELDALVERAFAHSPSLAAAQATLRQAQQLAAAQAGATELPTVGAKLSGSRIESNSASLGQPGHNQNLYNLYNAGITVNYSFDLFGANRRAVEALQAQADSAGYQLAAARLTLAGNVVTAAITRAQLQAQLDASAAILHDQLQALDIARQRVDIGAIARLDLLSLQTQVEQTRASLPPLRNRLQQTDHLLAVLTGQAPGAAELPAIGLDALQLPAQLPVVVPSALVQARPDLQAAQALLHAATAQYGVAVASLYPQINLSAGLGAQALTTGALFGPGSTVWNLAGGLAQPLFNAGLRAGANAAEANLQAAGANYQQAVLNALRNVADALRQLDNDAQALRAESDADAAAQSAQQLVRQQFELGAASYLQLLTAQQQAQQTRINWVGARAARLADSAALFQAMGGGAIHAPTTAAR